MLTKAQLIDSVLELNPIACREWLAEFSTEDVHAYLERLRFAHAPRGGTSVWPRPCRNLADDTETIERRAA